MFDYIWRNKEWLFSGVGVSAVFGLIVLFRTLRAKSEGRRAGLLPAGMVARASGVLPLQEDQYSLTTLTPSAIFAAVRSRPLLQQAEAARHYYGLRVSWRGKLAIATSKPDGRIYLSLMDGNVFVDFSVDHTKYPGLSLLVADADIAVTGVVESIGAPRTIVLSQAVPVFQIAGGSVNS